MKRIGIIALITTLALAHFASAADEYRSAARARQAAAVARVSARQPAQARQRPAVSTPSQAAVRAQQFRRTAPRFDSDVVRQPRTRSTEYNLPRRQLESPAVAPTTTVDQTATAAATTDTDPQLRGHRRRGDWSDRTDGIRDGGTRDGAYHKRRHHDGDHSGWNHHQHDRTHHHRDWWRSHYTRFVLFGGGYYYWNSGFWYPAYGYDPYYNSYLYDAPIYGYNDLPPEQVMANVQSELARRGYYYGAIDGTYGPQTRAALVRFQQANGLAQTGMIDEPTLRVLGLY